MGMDFTDIQKLKKELFTYSEDLHSSYLFYTMTCDKLVKEVEQLKAENENLKHKIEVTKKTLVKSNKSGKINDTIWVDKLTTLWDYLGIEVNE